MCVYARACILVCLGAWRDQNKASDPLDLEFQEALNCHVGTNLVPLKSRNRSSQLSHNSNPISSNAYVHGFQKHFRFLKSSLDASFWNSFFFFKFMIYLFYVCAYLSVCAGAHGDQKRVSDLWNIVSQPEMAVGHWTLCPLQEQHKPSPHPVSSAPGLMWFTYIHGMQNNHT